MRSFFGTIFCLLIVGSAVGWHLNKDHAEAARTVENARRLLNHSKTILADRQVELETLKRHYDLQRRIYDTNHSLAEARAVMTELQETVASQKRTYQAVLDSRRNTAKGSVLDFVELTDGRVLRKAKILNFDDTTLSFQASNGVLKIGAQELPAHLRDYFRLDLIEPETEPVVNSIASQGTYTPGSSSAGSYVQGNYNNAAASSSNKSSGGFQYTVSSFSNGQGEMNHDEKVKLISANIQALGNQISYLEKAKNSPLTGFDANLRPGSGAYKFRKKSRDEKFDREIAIYAARRRSFEVQRRQLLNSGVSSR